MTLDKATQQELAEIYEHLSSNLAVRPKDNVSAEEIAQAFEYAKAAILKIYDENGLAGRDEVADATSMLELREVLGRHGYSRER